MSDAADAFHEWMHSMHTAKLFAEAEALLNTRRQMLINTCAMTTDLKVAQCYGEYTKALALHSMLKEGKL